ncbi:UTRA domain-containing protein [Asticcacaulis sp.]|uniref:UTRA domain-containing protein n=1 Tax=Asticcacaulis sp. TaxID=1872648 RepID=UPI003F7CB1EB
MTTKRSLARPDWWMDMAEAGSEAGNLRHYLGVRDSIAARIESGALAQGACLPSERQLQIGTGAARGTVRAALIQLEAEGLIYRKDRSGWYVAPPPVVYDPTRLEGFMSYVSAQGRVPLTETLSAHEIAAPVAVAEILSIAPDAPIYEIRRRRYIDGRAVLLERIYVLPEVAPGVIEHNLDQSLTSLLRDNYNISLERNWVEMQPCALTGDEASALRIKTGLPGLRLRRICYDALGRVVEYDIEHWRHDALKVCVDIRGR